MKRKFILPALLVGMLATTAWITPTVQAQAPAPRRIVVVAKRFSYNTGEITLKKGEPVVLALKSQDVAHGLRIRGLKVNLKVKAGGTKEVEITPEKTGEFIGHCSVFCGSGHGSMSLKVHVVE